MKDSFVNLLKKELEKPQTWEKPSSGQEILLRNRSSLSPSLLLELKAPEALSVQLKSTGYSISLGPINKVNPEELKGNFAISEAVTTAKIFFAYFGSPIQKALTKKELKAMYKNLAKKLHPDLNPEKYKVRAFLDLKKHFEALDSAWKAIDK
ncbi:MAG: hypothetical protein AB8E15_01595 [Bdellovibrionales bacterium]